MKFYCEYCKSYLTHDKMSVRKSHLMGKNHIKFYCNYYEMKAKEMNLNEDDGGINLNYINNGPGCLNETEFKLPPPATSKGLPNPPPNVLNDSARQKEAIAFHINKE